MFSPVCLPTSSISWAGSSDNACAYGAAAGVWGRSTYRVSSLGAERPVSHVVVAEGLTLSATWCFEAGIEPSCLPSDKTLFQTSSSAMWSLA